MTTLYNSYTSQLWTETSSSNTSSATMPSTSHYEYVPSTNMGEHFKVIVDKSILNKLGKINGEIKESINTNAFKTVRFNPDDLWSEPKCLKKHIVQSVEGKSQLDITPPIKTLQLEMDKSLGTIFTKE